MAIPSPIPARQTPTSNAQSGTITPSNKSSQSQQAASQNLPQGMAETGGAGVIAGAGSHGRRVMTGKLGRPSFK